jgi:hypothetical protein
MAYALKSRFLLRSRSRLSISTLLKVDLDTFKSQSRRVEKSRSRSRLVSTVETTNLTKNPLILNSSQLQWDLCNLITITSSAH